MNKRLVSLMVAALALLSASGQVNFTHVGQYPVIELTPEKTTGLDKIYVVYDTEGVGMTVNSKTGEPAKWETFYYHDGNLVMETIPDVRWDGMATTLDKVRPNIGYKIDDGSKPFYCWVVNYADYYLELNDMSIINDKPCTFVKFNVDGQGSRIPYSTVDGHPMYLDREIKLSYNTQERDDSTEWVDVPVVETFESLEESIEAAQPLCDTDFTLSGDRFLEEWNLGVKIMYLSYETQAVACGAIAVQEKRNNENEENPEEGLGGSSPVHIVFTGFPSEAVVYRVWEMATDPDFENVILQYNQDVVDYTFSETGTYYMRYMVANAEGNCEAYSDVFTIPVSESYLPERLPNVFSPGLRDNVNDVWRVPYKSLVEFHCWIYNRWGNLVYEYTDPAGGWDGTYRGKLVDTGVYYYVLTATGSDGVKYKRRGDINILNYKRGGTGTSNGTGMGGGF